MVGRDERKRERRVDKGRILTHQFYLFVHMYNLFLLHHIASIFIFTFEFMFFRKCVFNTEIIFRFLHPCLGGKGGKYLRKNSFHISFFFSWKKNTRENENS